jgi:hypothetical protein
MIARRLTLGSLVSLCTVVGLLALAAAPALAARGHVFGKTFGEACSTLPSEPCLEGHDGQFNEPSGVAVNEATGDVYVVDKGDARVQWFNSTGEYEGQFNGPSAKGEGMLLAGSQFIEFVATTAGTGKFSVGEEISGEDIPPGTTIEEVVNESSLKISQPAEGTPAAAVSLTAHQSFSFIPPNDGSSSSQEAGIAVDNACRLHGLTEATTPTCADFDPSNGDVYVTTAKFERGGPRTGQVDKFSPQGVYLGQIAGGYDGVSVDAAGNLWLYQEAPGSSGTGQVTEYTNAASNVFVPPQHPLQRESANGTEFPETGFAVDAEDDFYDLRGSLIYKNGHSGPTIENDFKFEEEFEILLDPVDDEGASAVAVELSSNDSYVDNLTAVDRFSPSKGLKVGESLERIGAGHLTKGAGVGVSSSSEDVYVADQAADRVDLFTSEPPGTPVVTGEGATQVTAASATLEAGVNGRGEPGEHGVTEYHFEYGRCATLAACAGSGYERSVSEDSFAPDFEVHDVSVNLQGLAGGAVYHYRVVATNARGTTDGESNANGEEVVHTFTTQALGGFVLPDGRQWEMVSPPDKHGALLETLGWSLAVQAAVDGDAIVYGANAPTEAYPQGYGFDDTQVLSVRGPGGWQSRDLAVPQQAGPGAPSKADGVPVGHGGEYMLFSEDLSLAVAQPFGGFTPSISTEASEQTAFLHTNFSSGDAEDPCTSSCFHPLVTGAQGFANVPEGTAFGEEGVCPEYGLICGPEYVGATPDLSHVALSSNAGLTPGTNGGLYEWSAGKLAFVGIGTLGNARGEITRHAISTDGSRVFWSNGNSSGQHLYMTDTVTGKTVQLSGGEDSVDFQDASSDGSRVFFTEGGHEGKGGDLYECGIVEEADGEPKCELSDLTPGGSLPGPIVGASEDGSYIYFVANGVLAPGAAPGTCNSNKSSHSDTCSLYVMHSTGGKWETKLVATLSGEDFDNWNGGYPELSKLTARVSPNGRWLAFMSDRELTGYDNRDAISGHFDEEVYLYHAPESLETESGSLSCASCNPTGGRPVGGFSVHGGAAIATFDTGWESVELAASLPAWGVYREGYADYQAPYLDDNGRLFFNARDPLVAQAVNGNWDVYEYEPPGVGSCTASSAIFSERTGGCVGLISSGGSTQESAFLGASETGGDVFFLTTAQLAPQDYDQSLDVYDAHECTGESPCLAPPPAQPPACDTEASCRATPAPQPEIYGAPSSATFNGPGDILPPAPTAVKPKVKSTKCKKGFAKKKKNKCVKTKKSKRAKRSSHDRRASR